MNDREYLSPVVQGWKKRQEAAEKRMTQGQSQAEKDRIAAIRKRHREWEAEQARKRREGVSEEVVAEPEPEPEPTPEVEESEPETSPEIKAVEDMDRGELVAELEAAGQKAHPNAKDSTLRRKVEALR